MKFLMRIPIAAMIVSAPFLIGCDDTPLLPAKDYTLSLLATPGSVTFDAAATDPIAVSVAATVLNVDGAPQQGITVYFSNIGGTLSSGSGGVTTNSAGIASVTLTVQPDDPNVQLSVTAVSGNLTKTVKIAKTIVGGANNPPTASIEATPLNTQVSAGSVVFDGGGSSDPDAGDAIASYLWVIDSDNHDSDKTNPITIQGIAPDEASVSFPSAGPPARTAFTNAQHLIVTLYVTDGSGAAAQTQISYTITAAPFAAERSSKR